MRFKEKLTEKGFTQEQIQAVSEAIKGELIPKERFDEVNGENASLKKKAEEFKEKQKELKATHLAEIEALKIDNAIETALIKAGAKNKKAVRAMLDRESIKIDENGVVGGIDEQIKGLKKSDGYMFETAPKLTGVAPGESKDGLPGKSFDEMTYSEQMEYLARTNN